MERGFYDVVIAGGGLSGLLVAARISASKPDCTILVAEKEEEVAGRLRTNGATSGNWACGLNQVTEELYDFADRSFQDIGEGEDNQFGSAIHSTPSTLGVLAANKLTHLTTEDFCQPKGARKIGGVAAEKAWTQVTPILDPDTLPKGKESLQFAKVWKQTRKNPAAVVLEHFSGSMGIPDIWQASPEVIAARSNDVRSGARIGPWEQTLRNLFASERLKSKITIKTKCRVIDANLHAGHWEIDTEQGPVAANNLVVAQPPWSALEWLPREYWPVPILNLALKTRPVSLVALTCEIKSPVDLPQLIMVTAEKVHASVREDKEITFKTPIAFEVSLDAPEVVKAIRRLKRAKKKLIAGCPDLELEGEHLKLVPTGWAQSTAAMDSRFQRKLESGNLVSHHLGFCGDAYGTSYRGDENIRESIVAVTDSIVTNLAANPPARQEE